MSGFGKGRKHARAKRVPAASKNFALKSDSIAKAKKRHAAAAPVCGACTEPLETHTREEIHLCATERA